MEAEVCHHGKLWTEQGQGAMYLPTHAVTVRLSATRLETGTAGVGQPGSEALASMAHPQAARPVEESEQGQGKNGPEDSGA